MAAPGERVVLGYVSGLHGVKGWVKIHSDTEPRDGVFAYPEWQLQKRGGGEMRHLAVAEHGGSHSKLIARLEGIDDREAAAGLVGCEIAVDRDALPGLSEGEWYWADLVGMEVITSDEVSLGTVERVMPTGAHDVLVIKGQGEERLLPFVQGEVIERIDAQASKVYTHWASDWF
jgi:16S rRNA processing protein RimM